ncbi:unnamed protein product [[Actinomadura] parvosata subsp. kistnae]|nr:unnamed protein product [Actinomadura parvosata subsp. kistnae]
MIVKRLPTVASYGEVMFNIGWVEFVFVFVIPVAILWLVIYTAVRAAIRHSR